MTRLLRRVLGDVRPHRRYAIGVLISTLCYALGRIAPPLVARLLLDRTLRGRPVEVLGETFLPDSAVLAVPVLILSLAGLLAGSQYLMRYWSGVLGQRLVGDLQVRLLAHLLRLPTAVLERKALGRHLVRFGNDMSSIRRFVSRSLPEFLRDGLTIAAILGALASLHMPLVWPVVAAVAAYVVVVVGIWRRLQPASRALRAERARIAGIAMDRLSVASTVKLTGRAQKEAAHLERAQDPVLAAVRRTSRLSGLMSAGAEIVVGIALAVALGLGARGVLAGTISRGEMVAFYGLALMLVSPLRALGRTVESLALGRVAFERFYGVIDRPGESGGRKALHVRRGRVALVGVRTGDAVVPDLRLEPGVTAVIGGPGSAAAFVGQALVRLRRPAAGSVTIDGKDIAEISLRSLRRAVAYIPEAPGLLKGSLRGNLRAGLGQVPDEAMVAALRAVGADWADDLNLRVGSAGRRLSPKQRWQVMCARAYLAHPAAVVFDGLPVDGEELDAMLAMLQASGVRTIVLVAERRPRAAAVDRVVELDAEAAHA